MATRSIVTSHPEIACEVCGRRLLRGEQPDVFLSGGQRRMVCELCVPRAAHEGWLREAEDRALSPRASGTRRTRSLLGRLRQRREGLADTEPAAAAMPLVEERDYEELYDFLDSAPSAKPASATPRSAQLPAKSEGSNVERALEVFNGGEHPRRVAGVARSLGTPSVTVLHAANGGDLVNVVVAWELCWYRYQVNIGDEQAGVQLLAQGMELDELPQQERLTNAQADERGELSLL
jgi:hypothetical protein